jgi:hypothetical protein
LIFRKLPRSPLFLLIPALLLSSCMSGELRELRKKLNDSFPSVSKLDQRWKAIQVTSKGVDALGQANTAVLISADVLEPRLAEQIEQQAKTVQAPASVSYQIADTEVDLEDQWIELSTSYLLKLDQPAVEIQGTASGGISPALLNGEVRLFPAFTALEVQKIRFIKPFEGNLDAIVPLINGVLRTFLERVNSAVQRTPLTISLDLTPISYDPVQQLAKITGLVEVTGHPLQLKFSIAASAVLIDEDAVQFLANLTHSGDTDVPAITVPEPPADLDEQRVTSEFNALERRFGDLRSALAETPPSNAVAWAVVSKNLIASSVNRALASPSLCASYNLDGMSLPYNVQIDTFKSDPIDCSPTVACDLEEDRRDCRRARECHISHDDRSCGRWFGNDPFCEAAKAAQNLAYEAEYRACLATPQFIVDAVCEAEKLASNVANKAKKDLCELDKVRIKGMCEAYKEVVTQVKEVANVSGEMGLEGKPRLCLDRVSVKDDLSSITVSGSLTADPVTVAGSMRYIPLNIPSHLGCPAEWTRDVSAMVKVGPLPYAVTVPVEIKPGEDRILLDYKVPELKIPAEMRPTPFEAVFARHPDLAVVCPGPAGIVGGATLVNAGYLEATGKDLAPELRGKLLLKSKEVQQSMALEPKLMKIGADTFKLVPQVGETVIGFVARR